jgi:transposase
MNDPFDSLDIDRLPHDVRAVLLAERAARMVAEKRADLLEKSNGQLEKQTDRLAEYVSRLEHLIKEMKRAIYGKKSEKIDQNQLELALEELETALAETQVAQAEAQGKSGSSNKPEQPAKRNLGHLPIELPRIENIIEPQSILCPCGCGKQMVKIGEDRSERLDIIPAQFQVIVTIRPIYAPPHDCDGKPVQALAPAHIIEGGLPSEGLIAHVLVSKYADHLPLYRQSQIFARSSGLDLHRSTLAGWCGTAAFHLRPVVDRMAEQIKNSGKLFMDETPLPVLDPGRGKTKKGYFRALARDDRGWSGASNSKAVGQTKRQEARSGSATTGNKTGPPGVIFNYAPGRGGQYAEEFLIGFDGTLQVDGYAGYNRLTKAEREGGLALLLANCWAHARRKLFDLHDSSPIAREGLVQIAALYKIEAEIRGLPAAERLAIRKARSTPLVEAFGKWLELQRSRVSKKSRLGEKLTYIANQWGGLQVFLQDGRVEIDSNAVENAIRPIALGRKNSLFAGHDEGGKNGALFASLIATCKMNDINPFDYLRTTLELIAKGHPQSKLNDLLPWNFKPPST